MSVLYFIHYLWRYISFRVSLHRILFPLWAQLTNDLHPSSTTPPHLHLTSPHTYIPCPPHTHMQGTHTTHRCSTTSTKVSPVIPEVTTVTIVSGMIKRIYSLYISKIFTLWNLLIKSIKKCYGKTTLYRLYLLMDPCLLLPPLRLCPERRSFTTW